MIAKIYKQMYQGPTKAEEFCHPSRIIMKLVSPLLHRKEFLVSSEHYYEKFRKLKNDTAYNMHT